MTINDLFRYFDLQSVRRSSEVESYGKSSARFPVIGQYLSLVLGIAVQPFLARYAENRVWDFHGSLGWLLFALIVGILIFPGVYKSALDAGTQHILVQFCTIFAGGIGWQSLLATVSKVVAS